MTERYFVAVFLKSNNSNIKVNVADRGDGLRMIDAWRAAVTGSPEKALIDLTGTGTVVSACLASEIAGMSLVDTQRLEEIALEAMRLRKRLEREADLPEDAA